MTIWANYTVPNLGLLFYKRLYQENRRLLSLDGDKLVFNVNKNTSEFNSYYEDLYHQNINEFRALLPEIGKQIFTLYTTYPGLLIGSGYIHGTKSEGDASIGFYFDYTSGLPVITGSSIKGVLRSLFESDIDEKRKKEYTGEQSCKAIRFIIEKYESAHMNDNSFTDFKDSLNTDNLNALKLEVFGDQDREGKDVFLEACIDIEKTNIERFLASDFITPHYPKVLENPVPLQFLKVLPEVGFKFQFILHDGILSAEQKEKIFQTILLTLGIGAKTNVGYGQFVNGEESEGNSLLKENALKNLNKNMKLSDLKSGNILHAEIIDIKNMILDFGDIKFTFPPRLIGVSSKGFVAKQIIKVEVTISGSGRNLRYTFKHLPS